MSARLPRDSRRRSLLDAAARLFVEHGYAETRLIDVARESGVSRQLLQRHFATKQVLFEALLDEHADALLTVVESAVSGGARVSDVLDDWLGYVEHEPFAAAFLFEDATGLSALASRHAAMRARAREVLASAVAIKAPGLSAAEREAWAELARSSAVGLARWWVAQPPAKRLPRSAVAELLADAYTAALAAATARPAAAPRT